MPPKAVGQSKPLTDRQKLYGDAEYDVWDFERDSLPEKARTHGNPSFKNIYASYDGHCLVTGSLPDNMLPQEIPGQGIRLDDRLSGLVYVTMNNAEAARNFPSEFDNSGMIRAAHCPPGDRLLIKARKGQPDMNGNIATENGLYYGWQNGLQLLCGKEGLYLVRPSHEKKLANTKLGWKITHRAVVLIDYHGMTILDDRVLRTQTITISSIDTCRKAIGRK